jgi:hypothetical protein
MGLFTGRKIAKATEAIRLALEAGLAFRQMLVLIGLEREALDQSESEGRVTEYIDAILRAIERRNFNSGNASAAIFLAFGGIQAIQQTGKQADLFWENSSLLDKVPEEYRNDLSSMAKEVSRLFINAASAWKKVLDDLEYM